MSIQNIIRFFIVFSLFTSCTKDYEFKLETPKKLAITKELNISITEVNSKPIDSIQFIINGKKVAKTSDFKAIVNIKDYRLGKHAVGVLIFYPGNTKKMTNTVTFLADKKYKNYDYKVVHQYPHDINAFTQGLEYYNGFLYESTGAPDRTLSSLRKVDLKTGEVLQKIEIDKKHFAEGITIFNNKIHLLTWTSKVGFVYDLETFKLEKEFPYLKSKEGWGFTNDGEKLIKTDGTERIWFLNPETFKEESYIEAYTNTSMAGKLNEIEYIDGKIYSNLWQKDFIVIINPENGAIEGSVNLEKLKKLTKTKNNNTQDVLNGIAYDKQNNRLFVTGKNWDSLFEIEIFEK